MSDLNKDWKVNDEFFYVNPGVQNKWTGKRCTIIRVNPFGWPSDGKNEYQAQIVGSNVNGIVFPRMMKETQE